MPQTHIVLALLLALAGTATGGETTPVAADILKLTEGARTKLVWMREAKGTAAGWSGEFQLAENKLRGCYDRWMLMGFDTAEGRERMLLSGPVSCANPLLTHDGSRVIYSDMRAQKTYVMDWDGSNKRVISQDSFYYLLCYWRDGKTGVEWAYVNDFGAAENPPGYDGDSLDKTDALESSPVGHGSRVYRIRLDDPTVRELVWSGEVKTFRVSSDGNFGGGGFAGAVQGVVDLRTKSLSEKGRGIEGGLAPDNSYRLLFLDKARQNILVSDRAANGVRPTKLTEGRSEFKAQRVGNVDWSSDPRFFTLNGPLEGEGNLQRAAIYLGRFKDDSTGAAGLVQVTDSGEFNTRAYAWVAAEQRGTEPAPTASMKVLPPRPLVPPSPEARQRYESAEADWVNSIGMKFRLIRAGSLNRWIAKDVKDGRTKVAKPFYLGVFEVTQEEWEKVMGNSPSEFKGPLLPVENVSWLEAQEFLQKLAALDNVKYRLPTELEWEYACRAGGATYFYWMHVFDGRYAWAAENSEGRTHEVGMRFPNAWGLYDMSGNVFEWTGDSLSMSQKGGQTIRSVVPVDLTANTCPIYRGGAFSSHVDYLMAGTQVYVPCGLNYRSRSLGLRVVRELKEQEAIPDKRTEGVTGSWPSNPDGIVFKWENAKSQALVYDPDGKPIANYFLMPKGLAWISQDYGMHFQNGEFPVEKGVGYVVAQVKRTNRLSIEMTATTLFEAEYGVCNTADKPLLSFASSAVAGNLALTQGAGMFRNNGMLSMRLNTSSRDGKEGVLSRVDLCYLTTAGLKGGAFPITDGTPLHVVITYEPGLTITYADGIKVAENRSVQGDFSQWAAHPFAFGGTAPLVSDGRVRSWRGDLEGICLYNRVLNEDEARRNAKLYRKRIEARKPASRLEVKGKLTAKSTVLTAAEIVPYRRELAVYEYAVEQVVSGEAKDKKIRVAHWVVMDGVLLAKAQAEIGKSFDLVLEPFAQHPQLDSERLSETLPIGDIPRYMDVGLIDENPVDPAALKAREEARKQLAVKLLGPKIDLAQVAPKILKLTGGARTKLVWIRGGDSGENGDNVGTLMGFDTQEGKERVLVPDASQCAAPFITHDGSRVIFADAGSQRAYVIDWDGRNQRLISQDRYSRPACYGWDRPTGVEWVYLDDRDSAERSSTCVGNAPFPQPRIYRVQLDNPSVRELVWEGAFDPGTFSVSADGKYAGGGFPWPNECVANLQERSLSHRGTGCQGCLAPDNSYRLYHWDGQHRSIIVYDGDGSNQRKVALMDQWPEFPCQHSCYPRWSNDPRFFALNGSVQNSMTGPHDVYLGKFSDGITAVLGYVQATSSDAYNGGIYAWIEPRASPATGTPATRATAKPLPPPAVIAPSPEASKARASAKADWINPRGMKFKLIPAGPAPNATTAGTKAFYLGVFEVTQAEWEKVMGSNPSEFKGPLLPVANVSWREVQAFLKQMSEQDKVTYRLPTNAEWEYACRAGTATRYFWGDLFDGRYAWMLENSEGRPHEAGTSLPNPWGLYDMAGNVFEWISEGQKEGGNQSDIGPVDEKKGYNIPFYRGGAFSSEAAYSGSNVRLTALPGLAYRSRALGFRVARDVEPGK